MKKLSQEAKFNLRAGFGSIVSNQSAIEAGRSLPWWSAIIVVIISTFLPVIPITVGIANTYGDTFVSGQYNYSFDRDAAINVVQLTNKNIGLVVDDDHYLNYYEDGNKVTLTSPKRLTEYVNEESGQYEFITTYLVSTDVKSINDYYSELLKQEYLIGTTQEKSDSDPEGSTYYIPNHFIFYNDGMIVYLVKNKTTTGVARFNGNFMRVASGDIVKRVATVEGLTTPTDIDDISTSYKNGVFKNYKELFNDSYAQIKESSLIYTTFIYYGIYLGLAILLGILIFILTRGKRNLNNYLKWYQCLFISFWSSFSPGVLALILGFIMQSYAMMFFILFMGVRIMWLSMKQLSSTYQPK